MNEELLSLLGATPEQIAQAQRRSGYEELGLLGQALSAAGAPAPRGTSTLGRLGQAAGMYTQAPRQTMDTLLQDLLRKQQIQDMQKKRTAEEAALARQSKIQEAIALPGTQQRIEALRGLGAFDVLSQMGEAEQKIRPLTRQPGQPDMTSPFLIYKQSNVPSVRKLAEQLDKSWQSGGLPDEKVNVRLGELARLEDRAMSREESKEERKLTRAEMAVDRQINREAQQTERDLKRLEGTGEQKLAAGFASRMEAANAIIEQLEPAGGLPTVTTSIAGSIPFVGGYAQRKFMSPEQQRYKQAADNWIRANLRKESGAVIGADEMAAEYATYFPMPGDDPATIQQKAEARKITTDAMKQNAGPVYRPTQGAKRPDLKGIKSTYGLE
jgi:hypothetical protein